MPRRQMRGETATDASNNDAQFRELLRDTLRNPAHSGSVLADARQQCTYREVGAHIEAIHTYLRSAGVRAGECITAAVPNTLPAAVTVLALLDGGHDVVLIAATARGAGIAADDASAARFSRWTLRVAADAAQPAPDLGNPAAYLQLEPNPSYSGVQPARSGHGARLYAHTSGSLGAPKFTIHTHERIVQCALRIIGRLQLDATCRIAVPTPIFHTYGLGSAFLPGLLTGASLDFQDRANLLSYFEREREFSPNVAFTTPTFCEALLRARKSPRRYRFVVTGGDRLSEFAREAAETLHGPLINAYGCTEMGSVAMGDLSMPPELRAATIGLPHPGVTWRVVGTGADAGTAATTGELQLQSRYGFIGYVDADGKVLHRPESFAGPWLCTRDLARRGPQGTVEILGRLDLSLNRYGMLLPFADVESRLRGIPGVSEAAVAAGCDDIRGRMLVAFCVLQPNEKTSAEELRATCARHLPAFAHPDILSIQERLPKLQSGKLDRRSLEIMARRESERSAVRSRRIE